jgi:hypothetical protein
MADRLISLLGNPQNARRMGESGKQVVAMKFSTAAQLQNTEQLYERLLLKTHERIEMLGRPNTSAVDEFESRPVASGSNLR